MNWKRGLLRLWLLLALLWSLAIAGLCWMEVKDGPYSNGLVTDTVVAKTGEPVARFRENPYREFIPVDQVISWRRLLAIWVGPPLLTLLLGYVLLWIGRGFHRG